MFKWIVMFDCLGVDMLVPCDEIMNRDVLNWMGGQKFNRELSRHLQIAKMRAQANPQRSPEIWAYECDQEMPYEEIRDLWESRPQYMADLVRKKGKCLYKLPREKNVIS